ncbi:hypothetical protein [Curtobacterium sp. MCPF17_051]|uniref:hypothetical protein n=1 Tax=Curtobacterium sp. MCPF17_051 TaxID=2175640 RepID=UPI0011B5BB2D|nr:hypothetical protein [Curtobacterium sp. MCPF17_051]
MMFEPDRSGTPRAYVAADVSPAEATRLAVEWANGLDTSQRLGIQIPHRNVLDENVVLAELHRSGEGAFAAWRHSPANSTSKGPQLSYYPDLEHLLRLERDSPAGIALVGADETHVPWIDAYRPLLLAGAAPANLLPVIDPVVEAAVATFTNSVNSSTALIDRRDRSKVIDGLQRLRDRGYTFTAAQLVAAALRHNWQGRAAFELGGISSEVLRGARKATRERYAEGIVDQWEAAASNGGPRDAQ